MEEKPLYGGHGCEFIEDVSDRLNCSICTRVLRNPHLAVCCGQHFCESCLNKWFTRQGKESCPHCRAEGEAFHHVIHKGLRSEINQLKIRCSNHGEGCQWIGELGDLEKHLESDNGCGIVMVECPNKCFTFSGIMVMKRKDVHNHLTQSCYLRPYQCEFCGLKDTYEAITGEGWFMTIKKRMIGDGDYLGHQTECPEVPVACPNKCGSNEIKRKDVVDHRSQCPQEPVRCPFAEAGCNVAVHRHQVEDHMSSNLQRHLLMVMKDNMKMKTELDHMKIELHESKLKLFETEAKLSTALDYIAWSNKLQKRGDFVRFQMPNFSEYRRSGKVWHSPPFYYREGYKMCLAVYANGVGKGAGTHVSVVVLHLKGEYDDQLKWPMKSCGFHFSSICLHEGYYQFLVCCPLQCQEASECKQIDCNDQFCSLNGGVLHLMNDCLTFNVEYDSCFLKVWID